MNRIITALRVQSNSLSQKTDYEFQNLNKSELVTLQIIKFYSHDTEWKACHLSASRWNIELVKFGGKELSKRQRIRIFNRLRDYGYVTSARHNGDRNKLNIYHITKQGLEYLRPIRVLKKCHFENTEMSLRADPTLYCISLKERKNDHRGHDSIDIVEEEKKEPPKLTLVKRLAALGTYRSVAERLIVQHGEEKVERAFNITKSFSPNNPGAYLSKILTGRGASNMDHSKNLPKSVERAYTISDKAESLAKATKILVSRGLEDPMLGHSLTPKERYVKTREYNSQCLSLAIQLENRSYKQ